MGQGSWIKQHGSLLLAMALYALAGCGGDPPSTVPPGIEDGADAGRTVADAGAPDSGEADGGSEARVSKILRVVGDPTPDVDFEGKIALQAILVHSETGVVPGAAVSFEIISGGGTLSAATATTDSVGIARVEFTAGTSQGQVYVIALAQDVAQADCADWAISVTAPVRTLQPEGESSLALVEPQQGSLSAVLTQRGRPVAGARVTFSATGVGLLLNGQAVSSRVATTNLQGIAAVEVGARSNLSEERTVTVIARADYADPFIFTVVIQPKPPCEADGDCEASEFCDEGGQCIPRPACMTGRDCSPGYECLSGVCVPVGASTCAESGSCPSGEYCDPVSERCLSGCEIDTDCAEPLVCSASHSCVSPTAQTCATDDCATGYVCAGGRCIPDVSGDSCSDSSGCDMGQYCNPVVEQCVPGCDSDDRCVADAVCELDSNTCVAKECEYDEACDVLYGPGKICNQFYRCVDAPSVLLDVSGSWSNMVQVFHVDDMLPTNVQDVLEKVDQAFQMASAVLGGQVGDLLDGFLPNWVPKEIVDAIAGAVSQAAGDYLPGWTPEVVHIGTDVLRVIKDFEIRSTLAIQPPVNGDPAAVSGVDTWQSAVFYWYTADCPPPRPGQAPDECALVQIDLTSGAFRPHATAFTGRVQNATLTIDTHYIEFQYGKAVRMLLETAIEALTGYQSVQAALLGYVDCAAVNSWVRETALSILEPLSELLDAVGMTAEEAVALIDVNPACTSGLNQAVTLITSNIDNLSAEVAITMAGSATIIRDPDNTSPSADHLVRGKWNGTFGGDPLPSGQALADWYADR